MGPELITRSRTYLAISVFLLCCFITLSVAGQNVFKRLPSDYETLGWAATIAFTEGPTVDNEGNVYFTDIPSNRIFRLSTNGVLTTFREGSNQANGLVFDIEGRLIACEGGDDKNPARITRTDLKSGKVEVIAQWFEGKRISKPNDVTIDGKGRVYFTDRLSGEVTADQTGVMAVYRIDVNGSIERILSEPEIISPNGLIISPDDKTFYLVEAGSKASLIRSYDLTPEGTVSNMRVFYDFGKGTRSADGISIDTEGNVYAAAGLNRIRGAETLATKAGIYVIAPSGELIEFIPIPGDTITNCAFGGPDMKTLYITTGMSLLTVQTKIPGTHR
ncbi:MAG: SMP-30/gluconolactonase/LRE family protein [Bacteroidetes bacterium]|nr:SMP-30/gluconolactonase/LRE family protein [Bacteroidota bacterium]MDA1121467.1 SMP-30/gluconolactonase/LRE family protein [Bacteroidota bacterium]